MYRFWVFLLPLYLCALGVQASVQQYGAESPDSLTIGIFPRRNPDVTVRMFRPLSDYLQQQLGIPVRLRTTANFPAFFQQLQQRQYDLVHYNQYHYVKTAQALDYQLIAQNEEFGERGIRGALSVHRDSGIDSLQQLKGKTIVFGGGKQAMMSYIVPRYLLLSAGLGSNDYRERIASNPPNAVLATYLQQADAAGAGEVVLRLPVVTDKIDSSKLKVVARSEAIAHLPWVVKRELPEPFKNKLARLLQGLKQTAAGRKILANAQLTGFNPVKDSDYDPHRSMIDTVEQGIQEQAQ
jgi:phosphonate transport system substrate-binding protein